MALSLGQSLDLPLALQVEAPAEEVEVQGEVPLLETVRSQVAETVLPFEVEALPLNGRNYLDLAALTPAVSRQNPVGNQRFPETSAVPGTGISVTGQRFINNTFVVDGLSANDDAADLPGTFFSQEVIREFQVVTSGGIAEFGRASAGTVNVLTRSGTNDWRGSAYGFFRDDALDAKNPLADQGRSPAVAIRSERGFPPGPGTDLRLREPRADPERLLQRHHHHGGQRGRGEPAARRHLLPKGRGSPPACSERATTARISLPAWTTGLRTAASSRPATASTTSRA